MQFQKGQKSKLAELGIEPKHLVVDCIIDAGVTIDVSCFGVDEHDRLSDDRYMVFYNQTSSPNGEVRLVLQAANARFELNLDALPAGIAKLVFTAAVDGEGDLKALNALSFRLGAGHNFELSAADFTQEKAIIIAELYRRDNLWRIGAVGQGFAGGLDALLAYFGGTLASGGTPTATPAPAPTAATRPTPSVSLVKRFEDKAPQLVSLAKKAAVALEKNQLSEVRARVALILDASGSMREQYTRGQVQETVNRVFPLAVHFDDNEALDVWAFANKAAKLSDIGFENYQNFVTQEQGGWCKWMDELNAAYNNEPVVIQSVIEFFADVSPPKFKKDGGFLGFGGKTDKSLPLHATPANPVGEPVLVIFISDGGVSKNEEIEYLLRWASTLPIFWQFVGIGGGSYGALDKLDHLSGRFVDNANFFALDDLNQISEVELYARLVGEFPSWLKSFQQTS